MDIRNRLRKDKKEPTEPLTRTYRMVVLFRQWRGTPFFHAGLVGFGMVSEWSNGVCKNWVQGNIVLQHNNITILKINIEANSEPRTITYDVAYNDKLDGYMEALRAAIKERDRENQRKQEEAKVKRLFEETRFDKGGDDSV